MSKDLRGVARLDDETTRLARAVEAGVREAAVASPSGAAAAGPGPRTNRAPLHVPVGLPAPGELSAAPIRAADLRRLGDEYAEAAMSRWSRPPPAG